MPPIKGLYTGALLAPERVPFGTLDAHLLGHAWPLALELNATAYDFDQPRWQQAGWCDVLSIRLISNRREKRLQAVRNPRNVARQYLDKRNGAEDAAPQSEGIEKALVLSHPLPQGRQLIAVVFRGTGGTTGEWEVNFDWQPTQGFHTGFLRLAQSFAQSASGVDLPAAGSAVGQPGLTLATVVDSLKSPDSPFRLLLTGYSQGGAVSQLYAHHLLKQGVLPQHLLGLGFASPSVALERIEDSRYPLFHLANADDLTPRVGSLYHIGQVWQHAASDALRAIWYGDAVQDAHFNEFLQLTLSLRNMRDASGFFVQLMRAAVGLPRADREAFFTALFAPMDDQPVTRSAVAQSAVTARVMLFKIVSEYRAFWGDMPPEEGELTVLRRILALGADYYPRMLWRAMARPHMLVRAPGEPPASYQYMVVKGLDSLTHIHNMDACLTQ